MRIVVNEYGVKGSIRESHEALIILDHLTDYYEGTKFHNRRT